MLLTDCLSSGSWLCGMPCLSVPIYTASVGRRQGCCETVGVQGVSRTHFAKFLENPDSSSRACRADLALKEGLYG